MIQLKEEVVQIVARAMYDASNARACGGDLWFPNSYDTRMAQVAITAFLQAERSEGGSP